MSDPLEQQQQQQQTRRMRVAVIGGGSAGLVMCRHLTARPDIFTTVVYEQASAIGGTWVYEDSTESEDYGLPRHSSMYKNLRIILPKELMAFMDYDFPPGPPSYVPREGVLQYLNDYCDHFDLRRHIKLLTRVVNVSPLSKEAGPTRWRVEVEDMVSREKHCEEFDAVAVCNGHYSIPKFPDIPDLEKFTGQVLHSHDFRDPEIFRGKRVLCVGAGASGMDISLQASAVAKQVHLSYHPPHGATNGFPECIEVLPCVRAADCSGFHFDDGTFREVDLVVLCTGYHFSFPFLSADCGIVVRQRRVLHLYKQLVNVRHPTMSVLSVPLFTVPFPLSDVQARFVAESLARPEILPTESEMLADTEAQMREVLLSGWPSKFYHRLEEKMWPYMEDLIRLGQLPITIPPWRVELHRISFRKRMEEFAMFRNLNYTITENGVTYR